MLLCTHRELFPLTSVLKAGFGRNMPTDAQLHAHPFTCVCKEQFRLTHTHMLMQRLLVLNNDIQLPRMSMSLPVFVRSYSMLLWKPNVILNPPPLFPSLFPCGSVPLCREKSVHKGEPGLVPNSGCSCQTVSNDPWQRQSVRQRHAGGPGELGCI